MSQSPLVVRTGRKFQQVLDGAREVFLRDGFEGASVDDIARAAGVSKATLYSYFPDKRLLFMEVAQVECTAMAERTMAMIDDSRPPREVLTAAASQTVPFLLSDFAQRIFKICSCARWSRRFPNRSRCYLVGILTSAAVQFDPAPLES